MSNARQLAANLPREGGLSNRNLIINGAMQVAQRGTSFTNYAGYTLDRWFIGNPATNSISQQYDNTIGMYYMDATTSAAWGIFQWVENLNVRHLKAGDKVTVSYWVNTSSDTFQIKTTNTNDDNYTPSVIETAGSWYRKAAVVTITSAQVSDIQSSAHLRFQFSPNQNSFQITGVQLEVGDTATPFEHRSYSDQLQACRRYYQNVYQRGNAAAGTYYSYYNRFSGNQIQFEPMRTGPTVSYSHTGGAFYWVDPGVSPYSANTTSGFSYGAHQPNSSSMGAIDFSQARTSYGSTPSNGGAYRLEASIIFHLDAEL